MPDQEGVIKYRLLHADKALEPNISTIELNTWRHVLHRLNLIGRQPDRYDGLGFGNISARIDGGRFIISGTQTGHLALLDSTQFAVIEQAAPELNQLTSHGFCKPSSEALTHAILYQQDHTIGAVIHVHCPEIWRNTAALDLPHTPADVAYGTVAMVAAVKQLFLEGRLNHLPILTTLGHEDGVIVFGDTVEQASLLLIKQFCRAIEVELDKQNQ